MRALSRVVRVAALVGLSLPGWSSAWSVDVHSSMTARAITALDDQIPRLPAEFASLMTRASQQPDLMRPRNLSLLRDVEAARHFINLELLEEDALPGSLAEFTKLLTRLSEDESSAIRPDWEFSSVGTLPYALAESTQRLAALFAQLRVRPDDPELMTMAMVVAGSLAHYAQDLCQPLHTTIHHDGRANSRGISPGTGIHRRVDRLPARLPDVVAATEIRRSRDLGPVLPAVIEALEESHYLVDEVYRLADDLRALDAGRGASSALRSFASERYLRSVTLAADLIHTAWRLSESVDLPYWNAPSGAGN